MDNILRVTLEATETLEEYLNDLSECVENEQERKKVLSIINRVIRAATQAKETLQ